jgi:hypothetical protein
VARFFSSYWRSGNRPRIPKIVALETRVIDPTGTTAMWYAKGEKAISWLWYKATLFCRGPALIMADLTQWQGSDCRFALRNRLWLYNYRP